MEALIGILGSGAGGALTGMLGTTIGGIFKWLNRKQDAKEAKAARDHELALYDRQAASDKAEREFELTKIDTIHQNEVEKVNAQGSWEGLKESYALQLTSEHNSRWVNNIRSLFRPFLTVMLITMSGAIVYWLLIETQTVIAGSALDELVRYCIQSIVYTACTASLWWFGDRSISPPGYK